MGNHTLYLIVGQVTLEARHATGAALSYALQQIRLPLAEVEFLTSQVRANAALAISTVT